MNLVASDVSRTIMHDYAIKHLMNILSPALYFNFYKTARQCS